MPRGSCTINLGDPAERARAVAAGYMWSGPVSAIEKALRDIIAGHIPMPSWMPLEWQVEMAVMGHPISPQLPFDPPSLRPAVEGGQADAG